MITNSLQSVTGYATDMLTNWRNEAVNQAQSANESALIRLASEGGFFLLSLAGVVETVFHSFLFLSVRGIWLCLPQWAANWEADYGTLTLENALVTSRYTMGNFVALFDNLSEDELDKESLFHKWFDPIAPYIKLETRNAYTDIACRIGF